MCIIELHSACLPHTVCVKKPLQFRTTPQDLHCTIHICSLQEPFTQSSRFNISIQRCYHSCMWCVYVCVCPYIQPNPSFHHSSSHFPSHCSHIQQPPVPSYVNRHPAARFPNQIRQNAQMCHCASQVYREKPPGKLWESSFNGEIFPHKHILFH